MKILWRVLVSLIVFVMIYLISIYIFSPEGQPLERWQLSFEGKKEFVSVPFEIKTKHPKLLTFTTSFEGKAGDTLVFPQVDGGGFAVYLNGKEIYQTGNLKNGTASIWNSIFSIPLSGYLKNGKNVLKVKVFALYNGGFAAAPYIGWRSQIERKILATKFLKSQITLVVMGMALALGLILFSLAFMDDRNRRRYFVIGMSAFFMSFYLIDLQYWNAGSILTYLLFRKFFLISLYMSVFLFFDGMERNLFTNLKLSKPFLAVMIGVSVCVFIQPTPSLFKEVLGVGSLFTVVLITISAIEVYWRKRYEMIYPLSLSMEIAIYAVILTLKGRPNAFLIPYVVMTLISGLGITLVKDYGRTYSNMLISHKASLTDPLTGAFNRNVLKDLRLSSQDVIAMIDMDAFKKLNDTYGHEKGDETLKLFCKKSEENLRSGDFVIRYGGDEFLMILRDCTRRDAVSIVERVKKSFEKEALKYGVTFSYGVERVEKSLEWALLRADSKMYSMKENLKKFSKKKRSLKEFR